MKKLLIITILGCTLHSTAFATGFETVSGKPIRSFNLKFKKVEAVSWSIKSGLNAATFVDNGVKTEAFYDYDGTLVATCKSVDLSALPENARYLFNQRYQDYIVNEVISYEDRAQFSYFVSMENAKNKLILKVTNGYISVFEKTLKN